MKTAYLVQNKLIIYPGSSIKDAGVGMAVGICANYNFSFCATYEESY